MASDMDFTAYKSTFDAVSPYTQALKPFPKRHSAFSRYTRPTAAFYDRQRVLSSSSLSIATFYDRYSVHFAPSSSVAMILPETHNPCMPIPSLQGQSFFYPVLHLHTSFSPDQLSFPFYYFLSSTSHTSQVRQRPYVISEHLQDTLEAFPIDLTLSLGSSSTKPTNIQDPQTIQNQIPKQSSLSLNKFFLDHTSTFVGYAIDYFRLATISTEELATFVANHYALRKPSNRTGQTNQSSLYIGVGKYQRTSRWETHIWLGYQEYLGASSTEEQAAVCYDRGVIHFGRFNAGLNFPLANYTSELRQLLTISDGQLIQMLRSQSTGISKIHPIYPQIRDIEYFVRLLGVQQCEHLGFNNFPLQIASEEQLTPDQLPLSLRKRKFTDHGSKIYRPISELFSTNPSKYQKLIDEVQK